MTTPAQRRVIAAFQATPLWQSSTDPTGAPWTAFLTEFNTAVAEGATFAGRRAVYAQLLSLLRQAAAQARTATTLSPAQRQAALAFCMSQITAFEPFDHPHAITA